MFAKYAGKRLCSGCRRGECPGEHIQYLIRNQMEQVQKKIDATLDDFDHVQRQLQKVANKVANNLGNVNIRQLQPLSSPNQYICE